MSNWIVSPPGLGGNGAKSAPTHLRLIHKGAIGTFVLSNGWVFVRWARKNNFVVMLQKSNRESPGTRDFETNGSTGAFWASDETPSMLGSPRLEHNPVRKSERNVVLNAWKLETRDATKVTLEVCIMGKLEAYRIWNTHPQHGIEGRHENQIPLLEAPKWFAIASFLVIFMSEVIGSSP